MKPTLLSIVIATSCALRAQATPPATLGEAGNGYRVTAALGDVDGDGIADLVLGQNGPFAVRLGLRNPTTHRFAEERQLGIAVACSCENAGQPQLVDLDHDGDLDLVALDTGMSVPERVVWFTNDGKGTFAAAVELRAATEQALRWTGQASACFVADGDGDGRLDLFVATPRVLCFAGGERGFSEQARDLGITSASAMSLAAWHGNGGIDLLTVENGQLVARPRTGDGFGAPTVVTAVEGDAGQARLGVADWNGDGRLDLMLGETAIPTQAVELDAEAKQRLSTAEQILTVIRAERARIDRSRPPLDDPAAMARRQERRQELDRWAEGPQTTSDALRARRRPGYESRVRFVFGKATGARDRVR